MSEFKAMKFWIGDDPELSERVQMALFARGIYWCFSGERIGYTSDNVLFVNNNQQMDRSGDLSREQFDDSENEEINIDWMRTTKPETIELNGKTYIKTELEEALRHIKPVE